MTAKPKVHAIDLFCGAGGLTAGFEQAGLRVIAGFDHDPNCRYPYESNTKATFVEGDVSTVNGEDLAKLWGSAKYRLLAGCAPCQPYSTYGRRYRKNTKSEDWQLVASFGRLVSESMPEIVTMENVPELVRHPVFRDFLETLSDYWVSWEIHECAEYGVPQTRKRLVLLATRVFDDPDFKLVKCPTVRTVRDAIGSLGALRAGESDPADPLHAAADLSELNLRRIRASQPGGTWRDWPTHLRSSCHVKASGSTFPSVYGRMEWDKPAPTMTTQCFGYGNGRFGHPEQDRAISLREAALLQTFPRDYAFVPPAARFSFVGVGRLVGNAVPVRIASTIGSAVAGHVSRHLEQSNVSAPGRSTSSRLQF